MAEEARRTEKPAAEKVAAQETVQQAENSGAGEAAADEDVRMTQAMENELAALEAEFESEGPQPSQPREQPAIDFEVALSGPHLALPGMTKGQEEEGGLMEQQGDAEPGNSAAKRLRLS